MAKRAIEPAERRRRANGEGSIYQRSSDGRWVGSAYVYTSTGGRKRKPVYGTSFEDVRRKLDQVKGNSANGVPIPDCNTTVADYLDYWLREVVIHRRPRTAEGYRSVVKNHINPVLGKKRLDKLAGADIRHFIAVCRQKCVCCVKKSDRKLPRDEQCCSAGKCCKRTPSTRQIQYIHAVLRNALSNAERDELVNRNVAKLVQIPTPRYKVGKGLSVKEVKRLLAAAEGTRLYALYVLAATLGLRRGELLGLRWQDIHFEDATLDVCKTLQRSSESMADCSSMTPRRRHPTPPFPSRRSPAVLCSPTVTNSARSWLAHKGFGLMKMASSSLPRSARRSTRVTSTGTLQPSGSRPGCGACGCTICGTPWSVCYSPSRHHRTSFRPSPATPTSTSP